MSLIYQHTRKHTITGFM